MAVTMKKVEKWAQKNKIAKLIKALSVENTDIRIAVIKAIGSTNDESAMHTLISLLKDPDPSVRAATVDALGTMCNSRSLEFIRQLWNNESDEIVREKAKSAINAIKEKAATEEKY